MLAVSWLAATAAVPPPVQTSLRFQPSTRTAPAPAQRVGKAVTKAGATENGYIPCDVAHAYGLNPNGLSGAGTTIALILGPTVTNIVSDLPEFDKAFGIRDTQLNVSTPFGPPQPGTTGFDWTFEIEQDTEWAHAVAPGATIDVVQAATDQLQASPQTDLLATTLWAAQHLHPDVVAMPWGANEAALTGVYGSGFESTFDGKFFPATNDAGKPVTYLSVVGDGHGFGAVWPAAAPTVVGVGGTSLAPQAFGYTGFPASHFDCSQATVPGGVNQRWETVWGGDACITGSCSGTGGGPSTSEPKPAWQAGFGPGSNRVTPDVAMLADPSTAPTVFVNGQFDGGLSGGLGVATALWAGVVATLDQELHLKGQPSESVSSSTSWVYSANAADFNDVVSGSSPRTSNDPCLTSGACVAAAGYDQVTGRGSPLVPKLIADLGGTVAPPPDPPTQVLAQPELLSAKISWTAPVLNGAPPIDHYTVTSNEGVSVQSTTTSVTFTGLKGWLPGPSGAATYVFTVTATSSAGTSTASAPSNAVVPVAGGTFHALTPTRTLDTRSGLGTPGGAKGPLGPNATISTQLLGQGGIPATGVQAVILNATVADTTGSSFLTVYPSGAQRPLASNLNWTPGQIVANMIELPVDSTGRAAIYNLSGNVDVIFDVQGWVSDAAHSPGSAGLENALPPSRILDTRSGNGAPAQPLGTAGTVDLQVTGRGGVPSSGVSAVIMNVTVADTTGASFLTVYPTGAARPVASSVNWFPGQVVPNRVQLPVGAGGKVTFFNNSGNVDVIADVVGWFTDGSTTASGSYYVSALAPGRVWDSRVDGNPPQPLGPSEFVPLEPQPPYTHATSVAQNVTVTDTTASSFMTIYPSDLAQPPLASDLNWVPGETVASFSVAKLGPDSTATPASSYFNFAGSADWVIDETGFYGDVITVSNTAAAPKAVRSPAFRPTFGSNAAWAAARS